MTDSDTTNAPDATPDPKIEQAAMRYLGRKAGTLDRREQGVLRQLLARRTVTRDINQSFDEGRGLGERLADAVARFGGSWTFILCFLGFLVLWILANELLRGEAPDPYPFIFLNLLLSMLAAFQAPVIMMSQNRQAAKDRADASHDYEVNLKSEIEIMGLHDKLDRIRNEELKAIVVKQEEQITLLSDLLERAIRNIPQDPAAR